MSFHFLLSTTGSINFDDFIQDSTGKYGPQISETTAQRGRLRSILKTTKKENGPTDSVKIVKIIDDYIPYLLSILSILDTGEGKLKKPFITSWRTTLSGSSLIKMDKYPRIEIESFQGELCFVLLTQAFAYSNWALLEGTNENQRAELLCRASGICTYISDTVLSNWIGGERKNEKLPLELQKELILAIARMTLADAQSISIRKATSTKISNSLMAKLSIGAANNFESARGLLYSVKGEVRNDLIKYVSNGALFHEALSRKYLAIEANDTGRMGEAIGLLESSQKLLSLILRKSKIKKEEMTSIQKRAREEDEIISNLLSTYIKVNDKVSFQKIICEEEILKLIPSGRSVLEAKKYSLPKDVFGPKTIMRDKMNDEHCNGIDIPKSMNSNMESQEYAGAGAYY